MMEKPEAKAPGFLFTHFLKGAAHEASARGVSKHNSAYFVRGSFWICPNRKYYAQMALAFFIAFTTYGTWLHGTSKGSGSVDPTHNQFGEDFIEPDSLREQFSRTRMDQPAYVLNEDERRVVLNALVQLAREKDWHLHAAHVRTNHVHLVISADRDPGRLMSDLKARATRDLARSGFGDSSRRRWTRHGSTQHLFDESTIDEKVHYTLHMQGKPMAYYDGTK